MAVTRSPQGRYRQRFQQSMPAVLTTNRTAAQPLALRPTWVLAGLGLVLLLGVALWIGLSPRFTVASAVVTGASRVCGEAVVAASGLRQQHILRVDERAAARRILEQVPSVKQVEISCGLPADCVIAVVEREPLLTWDSGEGLLWVDAAGAAFAAPQLLEGRWVVSGPLPVDERGLVDSEVLLGLAELTRLGIRPGPISYRPGRGLVLDDPAGWRIVLGQGTGMEQRLRVYAAVRAYLLAEGIHPRFVDVRFPAAPYYSESSDW